jgi:tellurite resistance protein TerC
MTHTLALWVGFHVFVFAVLAIDLGVFNRKAHVPSFREALGWTVVWVTLAMLFAAGIWQLEGPHKAVQFVTGYIIEESLSVDNIFVFVLIFTFFAVPRQLQHRVLFWGILGAIVSRGTMIALGVALFSRFAWIGYVFGAFLLYTGFKMLVEKEKELHPEKNPFVRLVSKILPVTRNYEGPHFFVRREGKTFATPLLLVLLVVESTDIVFAVDSIPAIFSVTTDAFIVYTSNIFAILGLRSLYFVLAGAMDKFRYLKPSLSAILLFVGAKMCAARWVHLEPHISLAVIVGILGLGIGASFIANRRDERRAGKSAD